MTIGYDLDGVLISDLNLPPHISIDEFLEMRSWVPHANFVPKGDYYIVTGRNSTDREYTEKWIEKNLSSNPPYRLFHDCPDYTQAAQYKASIINQFSIMVFIESDPEQVKYLKEHCRYCRVYHFGSLVSETFYNL